MAGLLRSLQSSVGALNLFLESDVTYWISPVHIQFHLPLFLSFMTSAPLGAQSRSPEPTYSCGWAQDGTSVFLEVLPWDLASLSLKCGLGGKVPPDPLLCFDVLLFSEPGQPGETGETEMTVKDICSSSSLFTGPLVLFTLGVVSISLSLATSCPVAFNRWKALWKS